jgi:HEAT repeat protein
LAEVLRDEKDPKLRRAAVRALGSAPATADTLAAIYASDADAGIREAALDGLMRQKNAKALIDLARKETDAKMKRQIVSRLSHMKSKEAADYLLELLQ